MTVREQAAFDFVRYASVWEDADVLCAALTPVARGGRLLSIASAGDNALALLTLDPAEVVAVDLSHAQLACLELRIAAFRDLADAELPEFLGFAADAAGCATKSSAVREQRSLGAWRQECYARLRPRLSDAAAAFWDGRQAAVRGGVVHAGKFERYFHVFRRFVLPLVHGAATVRALRGARTLSDQERFYRERWDSWRWRALFRVFFGRHVMGWLGRDPAFFAHVEGSVAERILERTRYALTALPTATNPYLAYVLTGEFPPGALPRYMRPEHRPEIRTRLDRVRVVAGAADEPPGPFDGFNLSDIFEYMSASEHEAAYRKLADHARPGARLVYWNMLAPRARPEALAGRARPLEALARTLHREDRAWFYHALHVDEVLPGADAMRADATVEHPT